MLICCSNFKLIFACFGGSFFNVFLRSFLAPFWAPGRLFKLTPKSRKTRAKPKSVQGPSRGRFLYAPRLPADPFARSAVSPQRNLLAAQSPCSAVSIIPSKPGRAPGVGQGPQKKGPGAQGRPGGPGGGARCARARADARFARGGPSGPWAPSGPRGPAYTQQKLCRTE